MISYAQNFEDVILNRLFHALPNGRYIDVGAESPVKDSVTRHFYEKGWSGINIEPSTRYWNELKQQRPKDINLNILLGDREAEVPYYEIENTGLSTIKTPPSKQLLQRLGFICNTSLKKMTTLSKIVQTYGMESIEFLKIDVEGAEREVLLGADFTKFRPLVIIVEAIAPVFEIKYGTIIQPVWDEFEPILLSYGYKFGFFDGLNRYYYGQEHPEFEELLSYPACVLDNFKLHINHSMNGRLVHGLKEYLLERLKLTLMKNK